jgi:hypothetical protein
MKTLKLLHGTDERASAVRELRFSREWQGSAVKLLLTDSIGVARYYAALRAWEIGGFGPNDPRGVVLKVTVKPADLSADLRAYQILNDALVLDGQEKIRPPAAKDWRRSLEEIGSVQHKGSIPERDVELVEYVTPAKRKRIDDPRPLVRSLAL